MYAHFSLVSVIGLEIAFSKPSTIEYLNMFTITDDTTFEELENYIKPFKSREKLPLNCSFCLSDFFTTKKQIQESIWKAKGNHFGRKNLLMFCSRSCKATHQNNVRGFGTSLRECTHCGVDILVTTSQLKDNNFCSRSCSATYNNLNKKYGTRRSKLEKWLEEQLKKLYPELEIHFNQKDAINSELDIYFPDLKLAVELNGIFHYEPIYGEDKLARIQNNDERKFQACIERGIEFCVIDVSGLTYFKPDKAQKFLTIITNLLAAKGVSVQTHVEGD